MPFEEQKNQEKVETGLMAALAGLAMRSLNWDQRMAEATQSANHQALYNKPPPKVEDDMQIVLGNITTTHEAPKPSKAGSLIKAAVGAGLIASGAGLAVGGPLVLDALRDLKGETVIQKEEGPRYLLDLGEPERE